MKTDDLIGLLARDAGPAPKALAARRLGVAMVVGLLLALPAAAWVKSPMPLASALMSEPGMWLKLGYAAVLAAVAVVWVSRLGKPGMPSGRWPLGLVLGVAVVGLIGVANLVAAPEGARAATVLGTSWRECPRSVLLLALPALGGLLWALRGLAPTRPRLAGFAAGITAGGVGAFAYALFCIEIAPAFIAVWYTLGVATTGALGALLGPRVLRW